jgi:hypothetical protein
LAVIRLRRRKGTALLAALGIAAGAATLAVVLAAGSVAQDQSVGRAVERLPAEQRAIRASWFGAYDPGLDATVERALRGVVREPPIRALLFRQASIDGKVFNLGAADRLGAWVRLRSGRLPRECSPRRCEVLQVAGSGPLPDLAGLRLRRVGRRGLVSSVPFLQTTAYGRAVDESYSFTSPKLAPPFLLTNDVSSAAALPIFRSIHRSYGWILPLGPHSLHPWSIDALTHRIARARSTLTTDSDYFDLSDRLSQLASTVSANKVTARRLLLVGGQAAALLLAFVVLAAASGRAEAEATRARLARYGAARWQVVLLSGAEATALALVATLVGWAIGIGLAALVARRTRRAARLAAVRRRTDSRPGREGEVTRLELLLADEPTARLDHANALAVVNLLARLARETGAAIVCASHDPIVTQHADAELRLAADEREPDLLASPRLGLSGRLTGDPRAIQPSGVFASADWKTQ